MKKICCLLIIFILTGFSIFGETIDEEVDFLLFMPNSGSQFADEEQSLIHLDNLAGYLINRNPDPGQIRVDGYTADVNNDIDSLVLSMERALFVIQELQRRGVPENLFASPGAFGAVDYWGSNINESQRSPNRRVIILLEGRILTPDTIEPAVPPAAPAPVPAEELEDPWQIYDRPRSGFPWWLLLLIPLLALILFLARKPREKTEETKPAEEKPVEEKPLPAPAPAVVAAPVPAAPVPVPIVPAPAAPVVIEYSYVDLTEEIRFRAYELYLDRQGQSENREEDWHRAVQEVCARHGAAGHETYMEDEIWWARRKSN